MHRGQVTGVFSFALPLHQGRDDLGPRAFLQKLQGPIRRQPAIEKVTMPLGIRSPFIKFITLGNENPALLESLHGCHDDVAGIGVKELQTNRFGPAT